MDKYQRDLIMRNFDHLVQETSIYQLEVMLNKFHELKIFNKWMIDKIKSYESDEEKIRSFYERTMKRGPDAFENLISALYFVRLSDLAGLLGEQRMDNTSIDQQEQNNSRNNEVVEYHIHPNRKGLVFIINVSKFQYNLNTDRNGSENDVRRLKAVWKSLGFEVIVEDNEEDKTKLDKSDFEKCIKKFSKEKKLAEVDSLFVFIMSHGNTKLTGSINPGLIDIVCSDGQFVRTDWIIEKFDNKNCKFMAKKPKVIFFQACRGDSKDFGFVTSDGFTGVSQVSPPKKKEYIPLLSDLLVIYSSLPGCVSHRDPEKGAWYIQHLCEVLEDKSKPKELREVLDQVSRDLSKFTGVFQIDHKEEYGFNKKLFLQR